MNAYSRLESGDSRKEAKDLRWQRNVGTAFPLDDQGYLVTLNCVIRDAERIQVTGGAGEKLDAELVGKDENGGISVLKVIRRGGFPFPRIRPVRDVKAGTRVFFLATPHGGPVAMVPGNVEAVRSSDGAIMVTVSGEPGTSGTPVFDEEGRIIGLLAFHLENGGLRRSSDSEKSYLVFPMEYAVLMARSIINRFEAKSGWLGVKASPNELMVGEVVPGSPAEKSGIRPGDRIVEFNDTPVHAPDDLIQAVGATRAGETVLVKIIRNGKMLLFSPRLERYPAQQKQ
ncbi:MAG: S1C family serine protease [Candidatus Latescibacterota bacterium]